MVADNENIHVDIGAESLSNIDIFIFSRLIPRSYIPRNIDIFNTLAKISINGLKLTCALLSTTF